MAQRVGRVIALLFHDRGTRRWWVVSSTPRPHFTPGKDPLPILQEAGWTPGPVWTFGKSRPHRDPIPDRIFLEELRKITRSPTMLDVAVHIRTGHLLNVFTASHFLQSFRDNCQQTKWYIPHGVCKYICDPNACKCSHAYGPFIVEYNSDVNKFTFMTVSVINQFTAALQLVCPLNGRNSWAFETCEWDLHAFKVCEKQSSVCVKLTACTQLSIPTHAQLQRHRLKFIKNHLKNSYVFRSSTIFRELQCSR